MQEGGRRKEIVQTLVLRPIPDPGLGDFSSGIVKRFPLQHRAAQQVFLMHLVAYATGAMDAVLALALTLHIDPIFVGAHHLSRFVFVTIAIPGIVHLFGRPQEDVDD
jgi:uncharacterized protein